MSESMNLMRIPRKGAEKELAGQPLGDMWPTTYEDHALHPPAVYSGEMQHSLTHRTLLATLDNITRDPSGTSLGPSLPSVGSLCDAPPLMAFPPEIRNRIYDKIFDDIEVHASTSTEASTIVLHFSALVSHIAPDPNESGKPRKLRLDRILSITETNTQIRAESLAQLWFKTTTVHFNLPLVSTLTIPSTHLPHVSILVTNPDSTRKDTILRPSDFPNLKKLILVPYERTTYCALPATLVAPAGANANPIAGLPSSNSTEADRKTEERARQAWEQFLSRFVKRTGRKRCIVDHFLFEKREYEIVFRFQYHGGRFDYTIVKEVAE
ncbi:hypothetical protein PMZ80_004317 [Knufia obscura]|uniref:Uncharacterized protein n=1 Tax=Knufia obscura TaxID=1635080 RepID=A0ABR0RSS4_9EURO|nr:hypothetical protein PMZ80_004317 [Knufia obscura]